MQSQVDRQFGAIIMRLIQKENLSRNESRDAFSTILADRTTEMQQGAFLSALTAKGETEEEVGVPAGRIQPVRALSKVYIPPSKFEVSPFIGFCERTPVFRKQEDEVADLIEVPLTEVLDDTHLTSRRLTTSYARDIDVPAFHFGGHIVWGATAMMLNEIKTLLRQCF